MIKHPIRKFFGLTVLYIVIILGIFLLQFRSESSISVTFGALRLQLTEAQNTQQEKQLKNRFQITFRGLILSANDATPVMVVKNDGSETAATLTGWQQNNDLSCTLFFDDDISIDFSVSDSTQDAALLMQAQLPSKTTSISIPYKPAGGYLVTEQTERRTIISSKSLQFEAEAAGVTPDRFVLTGKNALATYNIFDPTKIFEFDSVHGFASATLDSYNATLRQFKTDFIQLFGQSISDSLPEQTVVAYVAAMAEAGSYNAAIEQIPSSIKSSTRRTYLSAPFFNSLVSMNNSLVMYMENRQNMINYAASQQSLDIFTLQDLAELLCITDQDIASKLLAMPATMEVFEPTAAQAAGILYTYTKLASLNTGFHSFLDPVIGICLESIATACTLDGDKLQLTENDTPLSLADTVAIGTSLIEYGHHTGITDYSATGYLIINSCLAADDNLSGDLRMMAELYPILVPNNTFYPHIEVIVPVTPSATGGMVWAWTAARSIGYNRDTEGNVTLSIDFPQGDTQYIILKGIEQFRRIDIYNMAFRTDPRFETYESSGYVYNGISKTLFLKSLHHASMENVKLYYDEQ